MKKILLILTLFILTFSCKDEDLLDIPAIGFLPSIAANGQEEGATTHTISMETTGVTTADAIVKIQVTNGEYLTTVPAMSNDVISLVMPKGTRDVSFDVTVGDDDLTVGYESLFTISNVEGGVKSILPTNQFTLFVADNDQKAFFADSFDGDLCKWINVDVAGSNNWEIRNFSDNNYAVISNYQSTGVADDWLIMPEIDFDSFTDEKLSFLSQTAYNDANTLEVVLLTDYAGSGDPSGASKVDLNPTLDPHRGGNFGDFTSSGTIDLSTMTGKGHIAFHYTAIDENDGSQWQLDDVLLSVNDLDGLITVEGGEDCSGTGGGGGGGNGPSGETFTIPFSDDFESCDTVGDYNIPTNWREEIVAGSKTDRGWGCRAFGIDGSGGARASTFGGDAGTDDAWLISDGVFDLSGVSSAELKFWIEERYSGPGAITVLWSTDYTGSGDPSSATWNELTDATTQITSVTAEVFTEITVNIDVAAGNSIFLAFRYAGGTDAESTAYVLDDLSITGN